MSSEKQNISSTVTKREIWRSHIDKWKESKLGQQAYCKQAGINYGTFVHWRGVLRKESGELKQAKFIPVKMQPSSLSSDAARAIQVKLTSGHAVFIPLAMGAKEIAELINLLGNAYA